eukprot:GFUD01137525.1.p1 GENE.GFUD01137525.1~~GFUD01137525.1.p1  ORF type:complete len:314 (-),score=93.94 GFUD01137525.1:18-959(-)
MSSQVLSWLESNDPSKSVSWSKGIPENLSSPPWRVPETLMRSKDINTLLEYSMQVQSSTIQTQMKSADDLQLLELNYFILSNASLTVAGLLSRYLKSIGISSKPVCGIFKPVVDFAGLKGAPSVFLKVDNFVIDNTYLHQTERATQKKNVKDFYSIIPKLRTGKAYLEESPSQTKLEMVGKKELGDNPEDSGEYLEKCCETDFNMLKHLANVCNNDDVNVGTVVYDRIMREFIKEKFEVEVGDVAEEVTKKCWGCGEAVEKLSACSGCQFARFCGKECITKEWGDMHKVMHRINKKYKEKKEARDLSIAKLKI